MALYALSVGANTDPLNTEDFPYTYEMSSSGMKVLPTFGVLFPHALMAELTNIPSLRFDPMMLLHGEQELVVADQPFPVSASVTTRGRITNVFDKGKGALVVFEATTTDNGTGRLLCVNRYVYSTSRLSV